MNKGICREIGTIGLHTHTTGSNETEELLLKRGAVSVVWKFFGFKKSDVEQTTIFCKCCWAKVVAAGGSTSNLLHHLIHKHVLEYQEFMKLRSAYDLCLQVKLALREKRRVRCHSKIRLLGGLPTTRKANGGMTLQTPSPST